MRRLITLLLIFLIGILSVGAMSSTTTFKINAYKVGTYDTPYISMEAYDALSSNLERIVSNDILDLSDYTTNLKNNTDDKSYTVEPYDKHVIFSFHVDGNCNGKYSLSVEIGPFVHSNADGTVIDASHIITAYYEMRDTSCIFTTNYKSTVENGGTASVPTLNPTSLTIKDSNSAGSFVSTWEISGIPAGKYENWRALGSVGISIDRASYLQASNDSRRKGLYMASVTIRLEVKE